MKNLLFVTLLLSCVNLVYCQNKDKAEKTQVPTNNTSSPSFVPPFFVPPSVLPPSNDPLSRNDQQKDFYLCISKEATLTGGADCLKKYEENITLKDCEDTADNKHHSLRLCFEKFRKKISHAECKSLKSKLPLLSAQQLLSCNKAADSDTPEDADSDTPEDADSDMLEDTDPKTQLLLNEQKKEFYRCVNPNNAPNQFFLFSLDNCFERYKQSITLKDCEDTAGKGHHHMLKCFHEFNYRITKTECENLWFRLPQIFMKQFLNCDNALENPITQTAAEIQAEQLKALAIQAVEKIAFNECVHPDNTFSIFKDTCLQRYKQSITLKDCEDTADKGHHILGHCFKEFKDRISKAECESLQDRLNSRYNRLIGATTKRWYVCDNTLKNPTSDAPEDKKN